MFVPLSLLVGLALPPSGAPTPSLLPKQEHQMQCRCFAVGSRSKDRKALGGFAESENFPMPNPGDLAVQWVTGPAESLHSQEFRGSIDPAQFQDQDRQPE